MGNPERLSLFKQVPINWKVKNGFRSLYEKVYSIRRSNPELVEGTFKALAAKAGNDVLAYERKSAGKTAICVFNFSKMPVSDVHIDVGEIENTKLDDAVSGRSYRVSNGKLILSLKGFGFLILVSHN